MTKNPRWFNQLYHEFSNPLYKFIAKHLGRDQGAVEEIFEETIVAGWCGYKTFGHKSSYFTWLCRIALNKIADYYHDQVNSRSKFVVPFLEDLARIDPTGMSMEERLVTDELRKDVNDCLNLLPPQKRRLLQLKYWENLSYKKIGELTGLSVRAVEGQLYRAKSEFAKNWSKVV